MKSVMIAILLSRELMSWSLLLEPLLKVPFRTHVASLPPPPNCVLHHKDRNGEVRINTTLWVLNSREALGSVPVVRKWKVATSCTVYFFGAEEKVLESRRQMLCDEECSKIAQDNSIKLGFSPHYSCRWTGTVKEESEVYEKTLSLVYPSTTGYVIVDGVSISYQDGTLHHELTAFGALRLSDNCPFIPVRSEQALSMRSVIGGVTLYSLTFPHSGLYMSISSDELPFKSDKCPQTIFPTDSIFFISYGEGAVKTTDSIRAILKPRVSEVSVQVNFNLQSLSEHLSEEFEALGFAHCNSNQHRYLKAIQKQDWDEIGYLLTSDSHATLSKDETGFTVETHSLLKPNITIDDVVESNSTTGKLIIKGGALFFHYVSGIVGSNPQADSYYPLLPLVNGSYYDIKNRRMDNRSQALRYSPWKFSPLHIDHDLPINRPPEILEREESPIVDRSNWFTDAWETVKGLIWWGKFMIGVIVVLCFSLLYRRLRAACQKQARPKIPAFSSFA
ncbi:putative glycoprotein [Hubei rhabdo-like virus 1]|uniref:putative glycoprotein n=1 Tax=Hubei rhabdo-like virus 1 TaxID=1923185 RepID=UPI000909BC30|nr:putative glycoprotein [Hubei rhabdo-like virus 1]APG78709.1 putative glycoprotein [Hubei rhabdo-like virus 1]